MMSKTNHPKGWAVVDPITASDATVVGSLSDAPETIPGPRTFHQRSEDFLPLKRRTFLDGQRDVASASGQTGSILQFLIRPLVPISNRNLLFQKLFNSARTRVRHQCD